ncbi:MAG: GNAT family N-acetyltransferase, partial [bacterium]
EMVSFHHLQEKHSALWEALKGYSGPSIGISKPNWSIHRALSIEKKPGFLLERMRSKHRSWIKKKEKELAQAFNGDVKWIWQKEFSDVGPICEKMEAVAKTTYQRGLGAGFVDNEETRERLSLFAKRGMLRVLLLEVRRQPISFRCGVLYRNTIHAAGAGYGQGPVY